uniref:Uncharacterized protein n=1 Tax=Arundo donax TaxID=35708 RepID=A0A0A9HLN4_ARUDO
MLYNLCSSRILCLLCCVHTTVNSF